MAQLEKRGEQTYRIRVFLGRKDGQRLYHEEVFHGEKKKALERKRDLEGDADAGRLEVLAKSPPGEYLDRWLVTVAKRVSPRTYHSYSDLLARYIRPKISSKLLSKIKAIRYPGRVGLDGPFASHGSIPSHGPSKCNRPNCSSPGEPRVRSGH